MAQEQGHTFHMGIGACIFKSKNAAFFQASQRYVLYQKIMDRTQRAVYVPFFLSSSGFLQYLDPGPVHPSDLSVIVELMDPAVNDTDIFLMVFLNSYFL